MPAKEIKIKSDKILSQELRLLEELSSKLDATSDYEKFIKKYNKKLATIPKSQREDFYRITRVALGAHIEKYSPQKINKALSDLPKVIEQLPNKSFNGLTPIIDQVTKEPEQLVKSRKEVMKNLQFIKLLPFTSETQKQINKKIDEIDKIYDKLEKAVAKNDKNAINQYTEDILNRIVDMTTILDVDYLKKQKEIILKS